VIESGEANMFLTKDELRQLTGSPLRTRQIKWLANAGWKFTINYQRQPIVARAEAIYQLVTAPAEEKREPSRIRWDRINEKASRLVKVDESG
jgi:hypothetical protein